MASTTDLLDSLLEPLDTPYGQPEVVARWLDLADIHARAAADRTLAEDLLALTRESFWAHLALLVVTHDEKDLSLRLKPFSPLRVYATLAAWFDQRDPATGMWANPTIAIKKSRQLLISWLCMARLDWCCLHRQKAYCFVLSENDEKAKAQVERVKTIHEHYPPWFRAVAGLHGTLTLSRGVCYSNGSLLNSVPQQSGRAAASYVPTMGLSDEAAFQDYFEKNWGSIKGGTDARSQIFAVSSVQPSAFMNLVGDKMDGTQGGRLATIHESTGLSIWVNRLNGVSCASVHYNCDPARRTAEWKKQAFAGYSGKWQWRMEQEMEADARGGAPIFKMLQREVHVTAGHIHITPVNGGREWDMTIEGYVDREGNQIHRKVNLLRAIDHGTSGFCAAVWIACDEDGDFFCYRVYKRTGLFAPENAQNIARLSWREELGEYGGYEYYVHNVIDAYQGLADKRGQVIDIYRQYQDERNFYPLQDLAGVVKGANSRAEGLNMVAAMLHSTLAVCAPNHPYWQEEAYERHHIESFARFGSLYLGRDVAEPLYAELEAARWDLPRSADPDAERPETSLNIADDALDCLRYLIRASTGNLLRQNETIRLL